MSGGEREPETAETSQEVDGTPAESAGDSADNIIESSDSVEDAEAAEDGHEGSSSAEGDDAGVAPAAEIGEAAAEEEPPTLVPRLAPAVPGPLSSSASAPLTPLQQGPLQPAIALPSPEAVAARLDAVSLAEKAHVESLRTALMEQEVALHEAKGNLATLTRERGRLEAREKRTRAALDSIEDRQRRLSEARDSLREWAGVRSPSFAWQLLERLASERALATRDYRMLREATARPLGEEVLTPAQLQDRFMKKVMAGFGTALGLYFIVLAMKRYIPGIADVQSPYNPFSWEWWVLALVALGAFILWWIVNLITFYRENSQRRQALRHASAYVDYLAQVGLQVRQEMQRLEALHEQVPEYLLYLSEVLHRPWEQPSVARGVNPEDEEEQAESPESLVFDTRRPSAEHMPSFMRLAECPPGAGSGAEATLVRDTVRSLVHRGWRFGALTGLLRAVEEAEAMPADAFAPARLDRDPRLRSALLRSLETSDARVIAGRERLRDLARRIQLTVMDEHHPPVRDIAPDPLDHLRLDDDMLGDGDRRLKEWDDFLGEALLEGSGWGTPAFSLEGRASIPEVVAQAYGPERLDDAHARSVGYTKLAERSVRPVELVVRIDRTSTSQGPSLFEVFSRGPVSPPAPVTIPVADQAWPELHNETLEPLTNLEPETVLEEDDSLA